MVISGTKCWRKSHFEHQQYIKDTTKESLLSLFYFWHSGKDKQFCEQKEPFRYTESHQQSWKITYLKMWVTKISVWTQVNKQVFVILKKWKRKIIILLNNL